jgi:PAS domain S-box-containing protein
MTRVLNVDDNDKNRYLLRALLQGHGYTVEDARDGAEALAKARQDPPDLVISDLLMPVLDGYTLLRQWKADERLKRIPFVVHTATFTEPKDERLARALGADAFLVKPSEPETLVTCVQDVLARAQRGTAPSAPEQATEAPELLEAYHDVLFGKLEKKALELEQANLELREEIAERKLTETALRESEERFRELAETIQEVFWMTDSRKERVLYVSPAYEKIWGRTCASLYASPGNWLEAIHPDDRERVAQAVHTKQTRGDYDETYRIRRPDGAVRWIRERAFPVHGDGDEVVRVVGTAQDITERRQLGEQVRQAQKMEAIGQLAAGVAHDFNNILSAILGNTQLALADTAQDHPARESLGEIEKAGVRGRSLVQQILAFGRLQPQERRIIELGPTLQEAFGFLRATIPSSVGIAISIDAAAPPVLADPTQVYQVIANLCTNAWHALEDRPGRIEISLESATLDAAAASRLVGLKPGHFACLRVKDSGKGMDAATLQRIFDPFFTTKEPGIGTGLGLSVVHGIVQGHDGAIEVASRPGRGTTFRVYFPSAPSVSAAPASVPIPQRGAGQHILYLDDEEPLVFLAVRMLERLGYEVTGFTRAADAMRAVRDRPGQFDLFITDLNMPGASGLQVAAEVLKVRPDLPVVLCSGHVTEELREQARNAGIREVLNKPNTMQELSETIHRVASQAKQP